MNTNLGPSDLKVRGVTSNIFMATLRTVERHCLIISPSRSAPGSVPSELYEELTGANSLVLVEARLSAHAYVALLARGLFQCRCLAQSRSARSFDKAEFIDFLCDG